MFLNYIHNFRAIAILFIIIGHSIFVFNWEENIFYKDLIYSTFSNGSLLFIFIAGYLFEHLSSDFSSRKYLSTKVKNVVIPYFFISIPALIIFIFFIEREGLSWLYNLSLIEQFFYFILTGKHLSPLWFIPMICIFYLIGPLLISLKDRNFFIWLIPIFIVISIFISRGEDPFQNSVHFFSTYLLGIFASKYKKIVNPILIKIPFLIFLIFIVFVTIFIDAYIAFDSNVTLALRYIQKTLMAIALLGILILTSNRNNFLLMSTIASYSFGIFFIHAYVIQSIKALIIYATSATLSLSLINFLILNLAVLFITMLIIKLIKLIFKKNSKYLIGC